MRKIVTAHKTLLHRTTREYIHKHTFIYVAAYHTYQIQQTKKKGTRNALNGTGFEAGN